MKPTRAQELAVLRSVVYASLFDYPLTLAQLHATLVEIRADAAMVAAWWRDSDFLQAAIEHRDGLYFPAGRSDLIGTRTRREALSRDLLERDQRLIALVARMPFVRMVAVSGSLAHLNAERSADLDLFVITAPHRVWSVTLSVLVAARLLGWRKRMCLNYVISEQALPIAPADLFAANQIIHLRPIAGHDVFARFVDANPFVRKFYPNFVVGGTPSPYPKTQDPGPKTPLLEKAARWIYGRHLSRRSATWQSRDQVRLEPECLKLHTSSHRRDTLVRYETAMNAAVQQARRAALAPSPARGTRHEAPSLI